MGFEALKGPLENEVGWHQGVKVNTKKIDATVMRSRRDFPKLLKLIYKATHEMTELCPA